MHTYILDLLPYKSSFRFVDEISFVDADKVTGHYTLKPDAFFYEDHFPGNPVTPGAILTEIMAQIGLVVLGIYLLTNGKEQALTAGGTRSGGAIQKPTAEASSDRADISASPGSAIFRTADPRRIFPLLSSANVEFFQPALPGQRLTVTSKKDYFRFGKLKCHVELHDSTGRFIAKGVFSGFLKTVESQQA